jgi:hypothetical protein
METPGMAMLVNLATSVYADSVHENDPYEEWTWGSFVLMPPHFYLIIVNMSQRLPSHKLLA